MEIIFNTSVYRNRKKLIVSRKNAKILIVNRKCHSPIETLSKGCNEPFLLSLPWRGRFDTRPGR